ncbi:MAG: triose-phosphate isomerase [Gammaproteobacteria bacterium]
MNPKSYSEAINLLDTYIENINNNKINLNDMDFIIAPPAIYLQAISLKLQKFNIFLSAQNICWENQGAFTGELSASSFKSIGCEFAIIGHSERRIYNKETDELIAKKCLVAINAGLTPIVCVGETKVEFDNQETWRVLTRQLEFLKNINTHFLVAYEPVWAIGTGVSADLAYIAKITDYIRDIFNSKNIKILYGGSVNEVNAKEIFQLQNLDGALVGGASLDAEQFAKICG